MLELARRFASRGTPPRRRMVFMAFCAEEAGQIGSRYDASKQPIFTVKETVAMMNVDMVGRLRDDELGIAGNESAREVVDLCEDVLDRLQIISRPTFVPPPRRKSPNESN
jgi:Zn-dependent M28 family amino/carboxypeptidase